MNRSRTLNSCNRLYTRKSMPFRTSKSYKQNEEVILVCIGKFKLFILIIFWKKKPYDKCQCTWCLCLCIHYYSYTLQRSVSYSLTYCFYIKYTYYYTYDTFNSKMVFFTRVGTFELLFVTVCVHIFSLRLNKFAS